jgi:hypothetical protein
MMSGVPLETCWAFKILWNNKFYYKVASCWLFLLILIFGSNPSIIFYCYTSSVCKMKATDESKISGHLRPIVCLAKQMEGAVRSFEIRNWKPLKQDTQRQSICLVWRSLNYLVCDRPMSLSHVVLFVSYSVAQNSDVMRVLSDIWVCEWWVGMLFWSVMWRRVVWYKSTEVTYDSF